MANFHMDQADGLRRMLATPRPRRVTLLSTLDTTERNAMLANLAASLCHVGQNAVLVDARLHPRMGAHLGIARKHVLLDVAHEHCALDQVLQATDQGFAFAALSNGRCPQLRKQDAQGRVSGVLEQLSERYDTLLVDAELDEHDELPVGVLEHSQLVVHVDASAESIKSGYSLIKRLSHNLGRSQFGVLVTHAEEARARLIYANLAQTARRYLATTLTYTGSIPTDDHLSRAARLGRSVIEAFPLAMASVAFRQVAGQLSLS